jgi:peptide/nickel transport system permease protein
MTGYILTRLAWMVVLLLGVSLATFAIFSVLPAADPALLRAGRGASPELVQAVTEQLGLDRSLPEQYLLYLEGIVTRLDFGRSYQTGLDVRELVLDRLPATAALAFGAMAVWLLVSIPLGILAAVRRGTWVDRAAMGLAVLAISAPVYWLGLVALYLVSNDVGLVPILPGQGAYPGEGTILSDPAGVASALLLPWLVLAASFAAVYARFLRGSLSEVMEEDYIRTARAKGLGERRVVLGHGVRAAITPLVTLLALDLGILLGGAILTETVFNIPGVGRLAYDAIQRGDLPVVQATVIIGAFLIVLLNFAVDVLYGFLDPRVRR